MSTAPLNLSIYGSCVSRDTVEFVDSPDVRLERYIARQSLISAFNDAASVSLELDRLASKFQRRMVEGDAVGSFRKELPRIAGDSDLLLWDLVDERLGVYQTVAGGFITRSFELIKSGNDVELQHSARLIPFGTDEHFDLWTSALEAFVLALDDLGCRERVRLIGVPWAEKGTRGEKAPWSHGMSARKANKLYRRYYLAAEARVDVVWIGAARKPLASADHKWGLAPFHYAPETYREIAEAVGIIDCRAAE